MPSLVKFDIVFDKPRAVYFAGEIVTGKVLVEVNAEKKCRGISLRAHGAAYVHWTEKASRGSGDRRRTVEEHYREEEEYFDDRVLLAGRKPTEQGNDLTLYPGVYKYPFAISLPKDAPDSFESMFGKIRYWFKATMDRPWRFDHNVKRFVTVLSVLNLNRVAAAPRPAKAQKEKTLLCLCCRTGPISVSVSMDKSGYVPGEHIPVNALVENHSSKILTYVNAELIQCVRCRAMGEAKYTTKVVGKLQNTDIPPHSTDEWEGRTLRVPPLPPTKLSGNCKIIDVTYILQFSVIPSGLSFDLVLPLTVIIGTKPLKRRPAPGAEANGRGGGQADKVSKNAIAPAPVAAGEPQEKTDDKENTDNYTFKESEFGQVEVKDKAESEYTKGDKTFVPVYAYFQVDSGTVQTTTKHGGIRV